MWAMNVPSWPEKAIFYQIFPDRFYRSGKAAPPAPSGPFESWSSPPTVRGFKGGDLWGVAAKLDYLADLGINAIYLNPVFASSANHRYHTSDYLQVDPITSSFRELSSPCSQFFPASSKPVLAEFVGLPPDRRCASFHFGIVLTTADNLCTGVNEVIGIPAAGPTSVTHNVGHFCPSLRRCERDVELAGETGSKPRCSPRTGPTNDYRRARPLFGFR